MLGIWAQAPPVIETAVDRRRNERGEQGYVKMAEKGKVISF